MRREIWVGILLTACGAAASLSGELPHDYFAATPPGSWARYETTMANGDKTAATYRRLADEDGAFVLEVTTEFVTGQAQGQTSASIFSLEPEFDWKSRLMEFGKALTGIVFVMEGRAPMPQNARMVAVMSDGMAEYEEPFEARGTATHGGIGCDVYGFGATLGGANPGTIDGEICLSAEVPFGRVHEASTMRQEKTGETSFETVLVDHGKGDPRAAPVRVAAASEPAGRVEPAESAKPAESKPRPTYLALAYQRGLVAFDFTVVSGSGGRELDVELTNLGSEPIVVSFDTTTLALEVGPPIGVLYFRPAESTRVAIAPGETAAPFRASQDPGRGVKSGSFRLVMKRGRPTLRGDLKVGKVQ